MSEENWVDLGAVEQFKQQPLQQITIGRTKLAVSYVNGRFGVISSVCNHVGGPLGDGRLDGEYVVCPWHNWKFHCRTGEGEPGYEEDKVPGYTIKEENGRLWVDLNSATQRHKKPHAPHPLSRPVVREAGPVRLLGISTTVMDKRNPRYSTSDALLEVALNHAQAELNAETKMIKLNDLLFRACEGYYSKSAHACTWPCSITQMDSKDQMDVVYEGIVFWADAIIVSTPIRWGNASSLYYKMAERLNCVQNQITIRNNVLIRNKVVSFIITGGQDNVQGVAGQLLTFFSELGFDIPQFPFIAHSRGWSAEDMERNMAYVQKSQELQDGAKALAQRTVEKAAGLLTMAPTTKTERAGRKAHMLKDEG